MSIRSVVAFAGALSLVVLTHAGSAFAADLKLLSATGMRPVLEELAPQFERASGHKVTIEYGASGAVKRQVDGGAMADVVIVTPLAMEQLIKEKKLAAETRTVLGRAGMGLAARAGAPKPAVDTPDALKRALLDAKSFAYAPDGVTGAHIERVFERLGIAAEMKAKVKQLANAELVMKALAAGEAELAFSGMNAIYNAHGVELVGPLPAELRDDVIYIAAAGSGSKNAEAGVAFIKFLVSERAAEVMKAKGLEPAAR